MYFIAPIMSPLDDGKIPFSNFSNIFSIQILHRLREPELDIEATASALSISLKNLKSYPVILVFYSAHIQFAYRISIFHFV